MVVQVKKRVGRGKRGVAWIEVGLEMLLKEWELARREIVKAKG